MEDKETKVLTPEEKRKFDGVTIEEGNVTGDISYEEAKDKEEENPFTYSQGTFKVYTLSRLSLRQKLSIAVCILLFFIVLFFFGGFILVGFLVLTAIGAVISLLSKFLR